MRCINAVSNKKIVILLTVSNTKHNDARNGIVYYICIISIPIVFYCNCTTIRPSYVNIFTAVIT